MDYRAVQEKVTTYMVSFLLAEVRLGITFVNIAAQAKERGKRQRYLCNAKEAYHNVVRQAGRGGLSGEDLQEVTSMLNTLKNAAQQLGPW